jgi:two-component sensor histidine kinase
MGNEDDRPAGNGSLSDKGRLDALRLTELMDGAAEESFDTLTRIARTSVRAPVALLSLVDEDRQFFKSQQGLPEPWASERETPLSYSFCRHVVATRMPLIINDARKSPLVQDNLAVRDLNVIAYLGVPLATRDGHALGTLCVIDGERRDWSAEDVASLRDLASVVMNEITLRSSLRHQIRTEAALRASQSKNRLLFKELNHRVNNAVAIVHSVVRQSLRSAQTLAQASVAIEGRLGALGRAHSLLTHDTEAVTDLRAIVKASVAPFSHRQGAIVIDGAKVVLPSRLALTFAMALHELATNAIRHGALQVDTGRVHISWTTSTHGAGAPRLELRWIEGGGPRVTPPRRRGFGSQLITRIARAQNAEVNLDYCDEGLRCTIAVDLSEELQVSTGSNAQMRGAATA